MLINALLITAVLTLPAISIISLSIGKMWTDIVSGLTAIGSIFIHSIVWLMMLEVYPEDGGPLIILLVLEVAAVFAYFFTLTEIRGALD
ncbi:hypothetical protein CR969_03465 [Candidatus Saccharibacteria bacterium]|nr:MAG: hypothetical protein CR969_03465 [Candidatus Saccharibacteria bacterium]